MANERNRLPAVGQVASADFLPVAVKELHDGRRNRHKLAILTLAVTMVCLSALVTSNFALSVATESLAAERNATEKIQVAQSSYSDIISLMHESRVLGLAYYIASEPEVNWPALIGVILKPLSGGAKITSIDLVGASPGVAGDSYPLSGQIITVTVDVNLSGNTYDAIEYFLLDARQWPGYSNSEVKDLHKTAGGYVATLNIHLGLKALVDEEKHRQVLEDRLVK